jgi:hypothetical protein
MLLVLIGIGKPLVGLTLEDARFCMDKELYSVLKRYEVSIFDSIKTPSPRAEWLKLAFEYSKVIKDPDLAADCHYLLATHYQDLDSAVQWILLSKSYLRIDESYLSTYQSELDTLKSCFPNPADSLVIKVYDEGLKEDEYFPVIRSLQSYNFVIEELAKAWIDQISVERSDSLAYQGIQEFMDNFPRSQWAQAAYYYELYHLSSSKNYAQLISRIGSGLGQSPEYSYISCIYLLSPQLRRSLSSQTENKIVLESIVSEIDTLLKDNQTEHQILFDQIDATTWANKLKLMQLKAKYYALINQYGYYGDEDSLMLSLSISKSQLVDLRVLCESLIFADNDAGELSELYYWKGKVEALSTDKASLLQAVKYMSLSLSYGSPRKRYDADAWNYIVAIHKSLRIKQETMTWVRKLRNYNGIRFADVTDAAGLDSTRYSRVALGDVDNDGWTDILFNGNKLYLNNLNGGFSDISESAGLGEYKTTGGLFADFNKDGLLDIFCASSADQGRGDTLLKNMGNIRFVTVNDKAGDVDDKSPSEGLAWVDIYGKGYPSLYVANYEKWQVRSGYPDYFWYNQDGYFADQSVSRGFRDPDYTADPGLAGRGVAPADFDNDGKQEILVTNYRLNRNFCWKQSDSLFVDVASLFGLQGKNKDGYFGHSIGADWGDYDNDGDLDLFIANLAHPRYMDISDVSMLLRNDGLQYNVVENDTIYYWQFTDVTSLAGITYDELHSDPLWFDADNDGLLDLFITSVYEHDRSYLYHNKGDGTFEDITWLAGARVFNGWGNASGDLNNDGLLDLVVGSGNATKILINQTVTKNKSIQIKPVWKNEQILLLRDPTEYTSNPNSPAFGTRVELILQDRKGKETRLIRELSSAKGTSSQNAPILHFGIGDLKVKALKRISYEKDKN